MRKDRLQELMSKSGHNPASLAEIIGSSERNIWRLLREDGKTSDETVVKIAQAFEVSTDYLLGTSNDPAPHMRVDNLTDKERAVLQALRRGEPMEAVKIISGG